MLFISRRAYADMETGRGGYVRYGVVDTDDGIEEIVDAEDIRLAIQVGVRDFEGVSVYEDSNGIRSIRPYQHPDYAVGSQAKLKLMRSIDVKVYKNIITDVYWNRMEVADGTSIRLSDYGVECADFVLFDSCSVGTATITLVFDDKIQDVTDWSFRLEPDAMSGSWVVGTGWPVMGIKFDLRELKNEPLAYKIYKQVCKYRHSGESIIDNPKRLKTFLDLCGG